MVDLWVEMVVMALAAYVVGVGTAWLFTFGRGRPRRLDGKRTDRE